MLTSAPREEEPMAQRQDQQRRASIHDVASRAGVSAATVSKVMAGVTTVKPENAQRVLDAIEQLGYRVDPLASDMRRAKRRIIGAIMPEFESEFFGQIITQLESLAEQRGYTLVAASSRESEARETEILARMHDWRVAGVVLAPVLNEHGPAADFMKANGMTGVLIDRVLSDDAFDTVSADSAAASAEVAPNAREALADVIKAVQSGSTVLVSGYHDASGDPAKNAELAKQRAMAVSDALKAAGAPEDKIELAKPEQSQADGPPSEARRGEVK
eukprot:gene8752-11841_t